MSLSILPYDYPPLSLESGDYFGPWKIINALFVASIDTTGGTSFPLKRLAQNQYDLKNVAGSDGLITVSPTFDISEIGATQFNVLGIAFKIPTGLTATNTNKLKVSTAIATAGPISAEAASTTFAAETVRSEMAFVNDGTAVSSGVVGGTFTSDQTFTLFSATTAGGVLGSTIASASGIKYVPVVITIATKALPVILPELTEIPGLNGRLE